MSFTIRALPHEIPLTTMDEHLVIGGKYFDVLNGTHELEQLNQQRYRLYLWSNFNWLPLSIYMPPGGRKISWRIYKTISCKFRKNEPSMVTRGEPK